MTDTTDMNPEQAELQERLKSMSPEELAELQKKNCIFCHIIGEKMPSKKVYEDDVCIAILDIHPANPGHLLVMPKEHYPVMAQMPDDVLGHCFVAAKALSRAVLKAVGANGTNILAANGPAAGQRANHFMIHLIPRKDGDGINLSLPENEISDADIEKIKAVLRPAAAKVFGVGENPEEPAGEKEQEGPGRENTEAGRAGKENGEQAEEKGSGEKLDLDSIADLLNAE